MNTSMACRLGVLAAAALVATSAPAQVLNSFMKIENIAGESTNQLHPGEIDLLGYSQSFGTANCSRAIASKRIDRASPALIALAVSRQIIPRVVVTIQRGGDTLQDFFVATLDSVVVNRIDISEENDQLTEKVTFAPRQITISYRPQRPDGSLGTTVVSSVTCQ